jgi:peptidoglycan/xylan/chitin deacetylase (PgdA/CDA1 family)
VTDVIVLCYHAVSDRWAADLSVTPAQLAEQVSLLLGRGYRAATFHDAVSAPPAAKTVAVTFDDGFALTCARAFAVLSRLGVPATVFAVTDLVGAAEPMRWPGIDQWVGGAHEAELRPATWPQLRQLADAGWEIGSHTCTHPHLTRCGDAELERELVDSKRRCEESLDRPCRSVAYPFGDVDSRVERAAAQAGYTAAGALPDRVRAADPLAWPRIGVWHRDTPPVFRVKVSPAFRALRASPAWNAVAAGRRLLELSRPQRAALR